MPSSGMPRSASSTPTCIMGEGRVNQGGKFDRAQVQDGQKTIEEEIAGVPRWTWQGARCLPAAALRHEVEGRRTLDHHDAPSSLAS